MDSAQGRDLREIALKSNGNGYGHGHTTMLTESQHATVELLRYWNLLWAHKWIIIVVTTVAALSMGVYTRFYKTKLYRAEALITPTAPGDDSELGLSSMGGFSGGGELGAILGFGGAGDNVVTAERYIAIMESYDFGVGLARRYHLAAQLGGLDAARMTDWQVHRLLNGRFSHEYDYKSGNLTLYFIDPQPARAKAILDLYLQSLRDKLRSEAVQTASAAALSLQDEVRRTPDALLQNQLYELMAHQIQREKLAQVQANFAFKVIDPPVVPDNYFAPSAREAAMLTGALILFSLCAFFIVREWIAAARIHLEAHSANRADATNPSALEWPIESRTRGESKQDGEPIAR